MEQHPVPQHIASYEFRLVGDMTLKQFLQVAGGALIALVFYATPLPGFIKWPLISISGLIGTALAFMPLEERPLSAWIVAFIGAIYSPTIYQSHPGTSNNVFAPEEEISAPESQIIAPTENTASREFAGNSPGTIGGTVISVFEEKEKTFIARILALFPNVVPEPKPSQEQEIIAPRPQLVVEELPILPIPKIQATPVATPRSVSQPVDQEPPPTQPGLVSPTLVGQRSQTTQARFEPDAAPPTPSAIPNVVVGQVVDYTGHVIESAILEIRDNEGRPVRALRTNKVGHFLTATPLTPGNYEIIVDKEGYLFSPIQFTATNQLIQPIEIRGKKIELT